jgi:hypothetical protein
MLHELERFWRNESRLVEDAVAALPPFTRFARAI